MMLQLPFPFHWADVPTATGRRPKAPVRRRILHGGPPPVQAVIPVVRLWDGGGTEGKSTRKCSPFARAKTINVSKLSKRQRQAAHSRSFWDIDIEALRPRSRADCKTGPRPCPWVGCRHHTALTVDLERGSIKETFPQLEIMSRPEGDGLHVLEQVVGTCSLDIADKVDDGTEGIGGLLALYQSASSGKPLGQAPGMTIEETGKVMNLSVERVRQLGGQAMQEVRVKLRVLER